MTLSDIQALRFANQQILQTRFTDPAALVAWMGAVQAQDFAMAKWALGLRLKKETDASVEKAIDAGGIIRTHIMRPTWHFVAKEDVRWMTDLTAPHVIRLAGTMYRQLKLDNAVFNITNDLIGKLLADGDELTREEIIAEVNKAGIETDNLRATHIMFQAELDKVICNGARRGKKFTYALFDRKVPAATVLPREEALAALAKRYFKSHGPATIQDFAWWSGLPVSDAKLGFEAVRGDFETAKVREWEYIFTGYSELPVMPSKALLIPPYDELTVGYADRRAAMDDAVAQNPESGNGIFKPSMMVKGKIVAAWRRTEKKDLVSIEITPLAKIPASAERSLQAAGASYARFIGKKNIVFERNEP
ncbi:winged helix DNA-binding domain-containing protein [Dyadobacter sp. CY261]|uniref:winged helix DNA-binding domain-containing protein n=1 Tax=Dyadobacter sp. CY261 TaxID=2907203 RepID=UPI001F209151|nr:winged helix DNA-binding domain-containing protein [Dyadobacter sp. CY261]MCF0071254.1 winged helix DNA-binding domain-containing protein [Dyadobacter sp. CY261]